ncbi:MAG: diguanylate cyclase [Gammaproteobacteria bacterium]|nr:diguanylate cyclase [Gammaproteobacteria bacterium]
MSSQNYLSEQVSLLESAFAYSHEGMILTDANSNIITINSAFASMTGYKKETLTGKNPRIMQSGFHDIKFYKEMWRSVREKGFWQGEVWDRKKDGEITPRSLQIKPIKNPQNKVIFYLGLMTDHSQLNAMTKLANQDPLTGLPNRRLLEKRLEHDLAHAKRHNKLMSLLYIDLDRFKHINDSCGHRIGDKLLIQVADRLKSAIRAEDTAARLGGDEFLVILSEVKSASDAKQVAKKIIANINQPFHIEAHIINIGCSIGYSIYPDHSNNLRSLINIADSAMYQAKETGRNTYC